MPPAPPSSSGPASGDDLPARTLDVHARLVAAYGERELKPRREPMHELISTMLSHRTTGRNEDLAYRRMRERFGDWADIERADVDELADAISPSNFAGAKAPNIQKTLRAIREQRGEYRIDFLRDLPLDDALRWLTDLPGVGVKTATLVLLFCFSRPVLPVDTHVHRITGRVGLIGPKVSAEKAHTRLLELLPPDPRVLYTFHINLLAHGRKICTFARPRCPKCVLREVCDYARGLEEVGDALGG